MEEIQNVTSNWTTFFNSAVAWMPKAIVAVVAALLIYFVGSWLIRVLKRIIDKSFERRNMDISLRRFLNDLINWVLNILLFIVVVTQLGVHTSAFVAIIGAAGLAIGLALQGSLSNFAGGILILLLKPFRIGDFISTSTNISGTVDEIDIFNTKLITPQNQKVVIPNGILSNSSITNYTTIGIRTTWIDIGISYDADIRKAKEILLDVIKSHPDTHSSPAPQVVATELGDSTINLSVRATTSTDRFGVLLEDLIINCKEALDKAGIDIPYPQRDIHIKNEKDA